MNTKNIQKYAPILMHIKELVRTARYTSFVAVNTEMLKTYFEIGRTIVEEEQKGEVRAEYGEQLLNILSKELTSEFGKGFDSSNLRRMRQFYTTYEKCETLSHKLTWSHYCELIKIDDTQKRKYFEKYTIQETLSVRDLKRQIYSLHYERLLLSKNKQALIQYEKRGNIPSTSEELIKDPYILEFLHLEERSEKVVINHNT